jgi:hypothetical protein
MDDISSDCVVLLLDERGQTILWYLNHWAGREYAVRSVRAFAAVPYHRYEIWRGLDLIAANAKDEFPAAPTISERSALSA